MTLMRTTPGESVEPTPDAPPADGLEKSAARGLFFVAARFVLERGIVFGVTLVLARLLTPDEFGVVAFALAVINYLDAATDLGVGAALVYRSDAREQRVASTAFWLGMGSALVLCALMWVAAPYIAAFGPGGQQTVWLVRFLALEYPLSAIGKVHEYRIMASLDFKRLVQPTSFSTLVKGVVIVVATALGAGVWGLVIGQLVGALVRSAALWRAERWHPKLTLSRAVTPSLLKFGTGIVLVGVIGQAAKNFDYLVVGAKLGAAALGFYFLAFRLPELVVLGVFQAANEVLFPFYARLKDASLNGADAELKEGYVQSVRISAAVALPAGLGMAALSLPIVLTFYGSEWRPSAGPMALVAIWAAISTLDQLPGVVFKATGRAWLLTLTSVIQISLILPAIWFGAYFGFTAVAAAQVIERTISLGILGIFVGRVLKIPWFTTFTASAPLLVPSLAMVAVIYPMTLVLPPAVALVLAVPVGLLVYAGLLRVCAPSLYHTLVTPAWRTVRARIRPTATSEAQPQLTQGGAQS